MVPKVFEPLNFYYNNNHNNKYHFIYRGGSVGRIFNFPWGPRWTVIVKGPLEVSMQICLFFNRSLQLPWAAKVKMIGINMSTCVLYRDLDRDFDKLSGLKT